MRQGMHAKFWRKYFLEENHFKELEVNGRMPLSLTTKMFFLWWEVNGLRLYPVAGFGVRDTELLVLSIRDLIFLFSV
jgi:hypothetical protein